MQADPFPPAIAIVEDEYIVALDIRNFLERSGYRVAGLFPSGDELISRFEELRPDLVLMDIRIKGSRDGVATASYLRDRWSAPVILLTAFADEETIARAKLTQPFGYIIKPFEERELRTAIEIGLYRAGMERKLRESEERFRRLFQEGLSGNFLADAEGRIVEANAAFKRLFGLSDGTSAPELRELFPDEASWQSFRTGLSASRNLELAELVMRRPGGGEVLVFANVALLLDAKGRENGIQGEFSDLTEKRRLEERLSQTQRMEAVGRLAGGIAHDFNNILTAIVGYASLLEGEPDLAPSVLEDLEGIRKAAGKASSLTRQLLAFSRQQAASPRNLDTNEIVHDMEKMLRRLLSEDIAFALDLDSSTPTIFADPSQVEQILVNLVVNAKDAMPDGGRLQILTRPEKLGESAIVGMDILPAGGYAVLMVRDTGTGIRPEILGRIFEPFFTTKTKDKGTGLGLSMVYGIAKQNGGAVEVSSELGSGTTFSVWLPASGSGALEDQKEDRGRPSASARPSTILLVDDDLEVRTLAERLLGRLGHRVLAAANAGEAILIAESHGRPIDLLVSDIVMPLMDGYSLARRLAAICPEIRILYISGYHERGADAEAAGRFLAKPFTEGELAEAVDRVLLSDQVGLPPVFPKTSA